MTQPPIIDTPENWDSASKGYSKNIAPLMMETFAEEFVELLDVNNNMNALEVAAGSGALTVALAKKVKTLLATDFAPQMLEQLKEKIRTHGMKNVNTQIMNGQALEINENELDCAACSFGLMLFPNRSKGFSELKRVVKPNGKVLVSGWAKPDKFEALGLFIQAMNKAFPDLPKPASPPPVFSLSDLASFKEQMENVGFNKVNVKYLDRKLTVNNFDTMWTMLTAGAPPVKMLFDRVGSDGKDKLQETLFKIIYDRFGNGAITITNTATVGIGNA